MLTTGRDYVATMLRLIGAIASGEAPEAREATDGLSALNRMLGSWSTENLVIYQTVTEEFSLTPNVQTYTMGVGGAFNTARPQTILSARLKDNSSTPAIEYPLSLLTDSEWSAIPMKGLTSTFPQRLHDDGAYPARALTLYPVPTGASLKLVVSSLKPLTSIATLDTSIDLPPGYEEAIIYNGAIRLAPEYGKAVSGEVAQIASTSKDSLKRANYRPSVLRVDSALVGSSGTFNIYTGGY